MIRLQRDRSKIPPDFTGEPRIRQMLKLLTLNAKGKRPFESGYWKKAKGQLKAESGGKCAYCEAAAATVAHCDVEHFRPKDHYWWLAYCYDNYLFSCQLCNQSYKRAKFPLSDEALKFQSPSPLPIDGDTEEAKKAFLHPLCPDPLDQAAVNAALAHWENEGALLVNPYSHFPETLFDFVAIPIDGTDKGAVEIAPKAGNALAKDFFKAVKQYYGINRAEIRLDRWNTYRPLKTMVKSLQSGLLAADPGLEAETRATLAAMADDSAPYAAMCRFFLREWGIVL